MEIKIIEKVVMSIHLFKNHHKQNTLDDFDIMIFNEVTSSSYFDSAYKLLPICRKSYRDIHFKIDDSYYDVFSYLADKIDYDNLYQIILCDNYAEIINFPQNDYDKKRYASRFSLISNRVHSFYDESLIVIETSEGRSDSKYINLSTAGF